MADVAEQGYRHKAKLRVKRNWVPGGVAVLKYFLDKFKEPIAFLAMANRAARHPYIFMREMTALPPDRRRGEAIAFVVGGSVAAALSTQLVDSLFTTGVKFELSDLKTLAFVACFAALLHFGVAAMRIPRRSYGLTLDVFSFAFALWGFATTVLFCGFLALMALWEVAVASVTVACQKELIACLADGTAMLPPQWWLTILNLASALLILGVPFVTALGLFYLTSMLAAAHDVGTVRSMGAVVVGLAVAIMTFALLMYSAAPDHEDLTDSLLLWISIFLFLLEKMGLPVLSFVPTLLISTSGRTAGFRKAGWLALSLVPLLLSAHLIWLTSDIRMYMEPGATRDIVLRYFSATRNHAMFAALACAIYALFLWRTRAKGSGTATSRMSSE